VCGRKSIFFRSLKVGKLGRLWRNESAVLHRSQGLRIHERYGRGSDNPLPLHIFFRAANPEITPLPSRENRNALGQLWLSPRRSPRSVVHLRMAQSRNCGRSCVRGSVYDNYNRLIRSRSKPLCRATRGSYIFHSIRLDKSPKSNPKPHCPSGC
jgi:hypothetical protein